ncbi:asparagine synthase (glutamine-hydrolyzing) [Xenococcus sp. PCC 7305]|uniref:asparagine synthase-related protein n=1 Tax=Xenococcus sp. PCC 7305 TaxID=102125 RepID=UPI0002ABBECD|nr:asparagine synthase-related protein [Xenococcus sp. PCC 7305]ELS04341.1 asparagine synthase (glutamine-hydrolyzing) [Xenococcus sp. PCC 7305]
MRIGFEVVLKADRKAEFNLFPAQQLPGLSLITFAQDPTKDLKVVLMGRIYYQDNLKNHFPEAFQQDLTSDADLILAIFRNYRFKGLEQLEGEFALVIFDPKQQCLLALRDSLGNYPLYWFSDSQTLRVSTNLQSLAKQSPHSSINQDFLASFLMFPYAYTELTIKKTAFNGIQRLLPGTLLEFYPNGNTNKIWSWDWLQHIQPIENIALPEAGSQFTHIFRQGIVERSKYGKIASHLSGGMDSSSVVCIARDRPSPKKLTTLSLVYKIRSLVGETDYIQMVLDQGGMIDSHYLDGDAAGDFQWFKEQIPEHDEPYPGLFHLAMEKVLVDLASELGISTIFTGGGSELITEGNRYHLADLISRGSWSKALQTARQWSQAKNQSLWSILYQLGIEPLLPLVLREGIPTAMRNGYGSWPKLGSFDIPPWVLPDFAKNYGMRDKAAAIVRQLSQYPIEQSFNLLGLRASVGNWASWYLAAPLGIHISEPFLDRRLITYCLSLPRELREVPGVPKPLLQEAMKGILPEPIRTRKYKRNFNEVYWKGLSRNLSYLEEMVHQSAIDELGIFDKSRLIEVMREHAIGIGDVRSGSRISSSLALIAWFDRMTNDR